MDISCVVQWLAVCEVMLADLTLLEVGVGSESVWCSFLFFTVDVWDVKSRDSDKTLVDRPPPGVKYPIQGATTYV